MSPRWLFFPSAAGDDWDTAVTSYFYATAQNTAISYINSSSEWDGLGSSGADVPPEKWLQASGTSVRINNTVSGGWNATAVNTAFPYVFVWDSVNGWQSLTQTTFGSFKPNIDFTVATIPNTSNPVAWTFYASDPGDSSGWRDYDGPTA